MALKVTIENEGPEALSLNCFTLHHGIALHDTRGQVDQGERILLEPGEKWEGQVGYRNGILVLQAQ